MPCYPKDVYYSRPYADDRYEYRHVILTKSLAKEMAELTRGTRLMSSREWRGLGITQSPGWEHYEIHRPEPHILLMRRKLPSVEHATSSPSARQPTDPAAPVALLPVVMPKTVVPPGAQTVPVHDDETIQERPLAMTSMTVGQLRGEPFDSGTCTREASGCAGFAAHAEAAAPCGQTGRAKWQCRYDARHGRPAHYKKWGRKRVACPNVGCEVSCTRSNLARHLRTCAHEAAL